VVVATVLQKIRSTSSVGRNDNIATGTTQRVRRLVRLDLK
jgi:hypothetical protein